MKSGGSKKLLGKVEQVMMKKNKTAIFNLFFIDLK